MNSEYSNPISKVTPHPPSPKKKKKTPYTKPRLSDNAYCWVFK